MVALATVDDLIAVAGAVDETRAPRLLEMASAVVERHCHRSFAYVEDDVVTVAAKSNLVRLPSGPWVFGAVTSITASDGSVWHQDGEYVALTVQVPVQTYPHTFLPVTLTVAGSHGYAAIPDDVIAAVCAIVGRTLATDIGIRNETLGSYTVRYDDTTGSGLTVGASEADLLAPYVIQPGSLQMVRA